MQHYLSFADKKIGLVICQALSVKSDAEVSGGAGAFSEQHIDYLKTLADAYHTNGTKFFSQLAFPEYGFYNDSSKNINDLKDNELDRIRDQFIYSAELCKKAGLDGIELHGAHTYFLNMMASSYSNQLQNKYGGDLAGRLMLVKEIVQGIKASTGNDFIVSYRMGWGDNLETDVETAQTLQEYGIDLLHVSTGIPQQRKLELPNDFEFNDVVFTGSYVKKHIDIPVICVNDIRTLSRGTKLIENGLSDFAAYGKPFLADNSFVEKSLEDSNYKPCFGCPKCQWFIDGDKCPAIKVRIAEKEKHK
jgi:2,4-dienoyl-CoA reductase-like NADH-dependent reductase (Old Yellow Enzyme family)